ncbi:protein Wnt-4-like [Sycon ciliatum]|uniref:protein Wnt-4-like n=1 Tax=Sycon ciliatum TaxID=27933 RepID=UPI0031F715C0
MADGKALWTCAVLLSVHLIGTCFGHFLPSAIEAVTRQRFLDETVQRRLCRNMPGLTDRQRSWCRTHLPFVGPIAQGARLGLRECRRQFMFERWNCPINDSTTNYHFIMSTGSREASFVSSIQAAGITLAIARTCSAGNVTRFCSCDTSVHDENIEHNIKGKFDWGGCGDNFAKGYQYSKEFLDVAHIEEEQGNQTALDVMELHNNEAGRVVVESTLQTICKCHGLTGACSVKICWRSLPKVQVVGLILKDKYRNALQMGISEAPDVDSPPHEEGSREPPRLVPLDHLAREAEPAELTYLHTSPDYCRPNATIGIKGTGERECNLESRGDDGCELLCCGNGHHPQRSVLRQQCKCKFVFCCKVVCEYCLVAWETHHCNDPLQLTARK